MGSMIGLENHPMREQILAWRRYAVEQRAKGENK
jgi:hypothetical protein